MTKPYMIGFTPAGAKLGFNEEYIVTYWDKSGAFAAQRDISVMFKSKGRHDQAIKVCISHTRCAPADVIRCVYQ